jgi:hypothetical protein
MDSIFRLISSYIRTNVIKLLAVLGSFAIFIIVFSLYTLPLEAVGYACFLTAIFLLLISIADFIRFCKKHKALTSIYKSSYIPASFFNQANDLIDRDYHKIIKVIDNKLKDIINAKDAAYADMIEYYTIWVHQIKTPISAMKLLLQAEPSDSNNELQEQLFKIEQYVEMVLQYLRMENMSNDLLLKRYSLDDIVKQAVRKYSKIFIRKKLKLNYKEFNYSVLTDEKWLCFVIEQLLSNALKYTNKGEISIYMDSTLTDTLVIEDTGIGIDAADLPRVFENGYTGFNGRFDKKSTGIGLYLCKRILDKLSHTITIESEPAAGCRVKIGLGMTKIAEE